MSGGPEPSVSQADWRVKCPQRWLRAASAYVEPEGVCVGPVGSLKVSGVVVISGLLPGSPSVLLLVELEVDERLRGADAGQAPDLAHHDVEEMVVVLADHLDEQVE